MEKYIITANANHFANVCTALISIPNGDIKHYILKMLSHLLVTECNTILWFAAVPHCMSITNDHNLHVVLNDIASMFKLQTTCGMSKPIKPSLLLKLLQQSGRIIPVEESNGQYLCKIKDKIPHHGVTYSVQVRTVYPISGMICDVVTKAISNVMFFELGIDCKPQFIVTIC